MDKRRIVILIITILGLLTTLKLAWIYYDANFNPYALSSFCSVNEFIDCDGVAKTAHSQFLGIPLALWGLFLYSFILFMLFVDRLQFGILKVFRNPLDYIAVLGIVSFTLSIGLLFISIFELKKLYALCLVTYLLNLAIAFAAREETFVKAFRQSIEDFVSAVKQYRVAFVVAVICAVVLFTYTTVSMVLAPQAKRARDLKEFIHAKINKYKVSGNLLGAENPEIVVDVYSDYKCPVCYAHNIMIHKLAHDLKNIKVVHHNLPLDTDCNGYLSRAFHEGACLGASYAIAAENQGNLWGMNDILFQFKPKTEEQILNLAKIAGFDVDKLEKDANSRATALKLKSEIDAAYAKGLNGTPVTMVGSDFILGIKPYKEFKSWVLKHD
jgi:uncharacterized membrane protein/predicted DsbA family dithiol-disulfide isomerase